MEKFIELVKAGKIEGFSIYNERLLLSFHGMSFVIGKPSEDEDHEEEWEWSEAYPDIACAHIRRWLSGKGWYWELYPHWIYVSDVEQGGKHYDSFKEGSELDWHIDAANWVVSREGKVVDG